jgi:hypothetical protein
MQTDLRCHGKTKLKDAVRTGVGKSKGKELFAVWILPLLVDQWELLGENFKRNQSFNKKTTFFCNDFKIRWSKNDGSSLFFDAISQNICKLAQLAEKYLTFHYVQTLLLEEQLLLMLC